MVSVPAGSAVGSAVGSAAAVAAGAEAAEAAASEARAWRVLGGVMDPEIPVVSVVDLGIVRQLNSPARGAIRVALSPTYSGCPATRVIRADVTRALQDAGFEAIDVVEQLAPAWSTDWISERGRERLARFGIAPPSARALPLCPRCASPRTECLSEFGSTPCKSLHRCLACLEPFDRFKCL